MIRLREYILDIVTKNHSVFLPGCLITYNALIDMKIFHSMKRKQRSRHGTIAMELGMSKAYDIVEQGFMRKLLLTMGFDSRWVNIIMDCVSTIS